MKDYMIRVAGTNSAVMGLACTTGTLVSGACRLHETTASACAALGRALTGGLLMGALMKKGQRVGLKFEGNGALKRIVVEADSDGLVRGYVGNPKADVPPRDGKIDVSGVLGRNGLLTVFKDVGVEEPYKGGGSANG